ncbi:MAG: hypothetical protein ACRDJ9_14045, partial [Dehalococcoidia bacterium]
MNREERRRAARAKQAQGYPAGRLERLSIVPEGRGAAERQDFLAGTIFAAGAGIVFPIAKSKTDPVPDGVGPLFMVFLNDDDSTFGPWPRLADLFARLETIGAAG